MGIPVMDIAQTAVNVFYFITNFVPAVQRFTAYSTNRLFPNQSPTLLDAIELRRRGIISEKLYEEYCLRQGWSPTFAERFWQAAETKLSADAVLLLFWRQEITETEYKEKMSVLGYTETEAVAFNQSRLFYPTPTDLVTWQAREVFEPDAIEKYGLDSEFERIDLEPFFKAGMDEEQIKNFWRAHWSHPPLTTIYSMLHRGLITEEDVFEYYRLVEIPPFWRDKLTAMSYRPYTRVDVRRMYEVGVLDRDAVKQSYLDLGYDDEKAENMTEFTVAWSQQKNRDLTRTQIERALEYGVLTEEQTVEMLKELGYDDLEAGLIITLKFYEIAQDEIDDKIATIKTQFRRGLVTQEEALMALDQLEISAVYRDKVVASILRDKQKEFQLPSKSDLVSFYTNEIIDEEQFKNYMNRLGFRETEIAFYIESLKL